jgi:carbamoyl-phosphate synthase large subunit/carbamoyl-phosphate synthase small subunit
MAKGDIFMNAENDFTIQPEESIERLHDAWFVLEDGSVYPGFSFGAPTNATGEVVFNTGMVGYPESLTDPSYAGQILVLTYPLIGNYGVPQDERDDLGLLKHFESDRIQISALIVSNYSHVPSHYTSNRSLSAWLREHNVPAISGLDTRALTKKIRERGALLGKVVFDKEAIKTLQFEDPNKRNLVAQVSRREPHTYGRGKLKILAVDCGMKNNIIRYFVYKGVELKVVPWDWDFEEENYDGLFISNGPGDPTMAKITVERLRNVIQNPNNDKPIFGICLGNQILALAAGAKTYKMKFGNRGMNQPCIDMRTTLCYITPQNHGYAVDNKTLPKDWQMLFMNANDYSNEGIIHRFKPYFSAQFHPEAKGGPTDTEFLFDMFLDRIRDRHTVISTVVMAPPSDRIIRKVLLLGSGGLSIGQAGEFDYSGSQAIKALKEESIEIVLINPNIATVQTSVGMADKVYFLPVTPDFVEQVIAKERPDGILLQFGGQTALNCGLALDKSGVLEKYNVKVLGTPTATIEATEDREIFANKLAEIGETCAPSVTVYSVEDAITAAKQIGYPVLVRAGFALGGLGSGFADNEEALEALARKALNSSSQLIIDKSLKGWKEVEYEVVRDIKGNCITVCNMENLDPLGIHTGDSIVVAPSQTLSNEEFYMLRSVALKVVRHLGVVGECNIQYALDPHSNQYCIIEVNARLSRSSALASKATGYPLAYVAAKLSLGMALTDIKNSVTKTTTACFEPALDYLVVKVPRWDMNKFNHVSDLIGSAMKSVGEVMAIGRTFEEAFQKALRMVDHSIDGFGDTRKCLFNDCTASELDQKLSQPSDQRVMALAIAFQRGYTVEQIYQLTKIDRWFLSKLKFIMNVEHLLTSNASKSLNYLTPESLLAVKRNGFSDRQIARYLRSTADDVRQLRKKHDIFPYVKQIDTLAAEFPAQTNYLYMTYNANEHDLTFEEHGIMVLGCGAYRIGSSCEFDWCAVSCLRTLRKQGFKSIMVNYNPETVSTDYDECDRLYFEELSLELVLDIYNIEKASGVVISVGGQIPNNLAIPLHKAGVKILGTSPESIDNAEDRSKFSKLMDDIHVDQAPWKSLTSVSEAHQFALEVGYPVLVRPSYVLSGAAMNIAENEHELKTYLSQASHLNLEHPVVISKFIVNAKEIEYDGVAMGGNIVNFAISEHVENAGVHSGDATLVLPAQKLYVETIKRIKKIASRIAQSLNITGPFNIQFLSKNNDIKVIECNLRSSRSLPFVSKTFNVNFVELATKVMIGAPVKAGRIELFDLDHVCVKVPMFSFTRLQGADPVLRVEMASTGEVACFSRRLFEAYLKGMLATGLRLPKKSILISAGPLSSKVEFLPAVEALARMGFELYATRGTAAFYARHGITMIPLAKNKEKPVVKKTLPSSSSCDELSFMNNTPVSTPSNKDLKEEVEAPNGPAVPNIISTLRSGLIDLVINIPNSTDPIDRTEGYYIRRTAVDFNVSLITNIKIAILFVDALEMVRDKDFSWEILSYDEYMRESKLD